MTWLGRLSLLLGRARRIEASGRNAIGGRSPAAAARPSSIAVTRSPIAHAEASGVATRIGRLSITVSRQRPRSPIAVLWHLEFFSRSESSMRPADRIGRRPSPAGGQLSALTPISDDRASPLLAFFAMRCEIRAGLAACRLSVTASRHQHRADIDLS